MEREGRQREQKTKSAPLDDFLRLDVMLVIFEHQVHPHEEVLPIRRSFSVGIEDPKLHQGAGLEQPLFDGLRVVARHGSQCQRFSKRLAAVRV